MRNPFLEKKITSANGDGSMEIGNYKGIVPRKVCNLSRKGMKAYREMSKDLFSWDNEIWKTVPYLWKKDEWKADKVVYSRWLLSILVYKAHHNESAKPKVTNFELQNEPSSWHLAIFNQLNTVLSGLFILFSQFQPKRQPPIPLCPAKFVANLKSNLLVLFG